MTWDITNDNYDLWHIKFNNGVQVYYVPKGRIYMEVSEPYLTIYWSQTEIDPKFNNKLIIDYNDVSSLPASATALMADIDAMNVSGFTGGTVQSVTGLDTDNTDPANPVVQISVDGNTITGQGTPADPLVAHSAGGANLWGYKSKTTITTGDPLSGHLIWDNATQISATQLNLSHITDDGFDIDLYFPFIVTGDILVVQDRDDSTNYQTWEVSSTPTIIPNSYIEIPVTLNSSGGTGTTNFANNHQLLVAKFSSSSSSGVNFSAGTSSANLGSVVFSNSNGVSFGLNGSTITAIHNGLTTQTIQPAVGLNTAQTNVTWTVNSSGISFDAGAYLTTARASNDAIGLNTAGTNITWTVNSSGISINAGAYLTTARASNDGIGLNTAQTNVTWTVNSSGISLNAGGYAGTATAATNATFTLNSNGLSLSVAAPVGGVTPAISGSNGSFSFSTVTFGNLNGASFYTSNGSMVMSYTVPAPGAGVAMSRFPYWGNQTNALSVATGTAGSTGGSTQITGIGYLNYLPVPNEIEFRDLMIEHSAATVNGTGSATMGNIFGIYTLEANTRLSLLSSFQNVLFFSQNSLTQQTYRYHWGTASSTNSTNLQGNISGSISGFRWMYLQQSEQTLAAGNYYFAHMYTQSTVGSALYNQSIAIVYSTGHTVNQFGNNAITYDFLARWNGAFSTTSNMSSVGLPLMPSTIHTSAISGTNNASQQRGLYFVMNRASTT